MQREIRTRILWDSTERAVRLFVVLLVAIAHVWASDEPWKGKTYKEWTEKDLERIFAYSPWSQKVELTRTWLPLKAEELPQMISGGVRNAPKGLEQSDEGTLGKEVNFNVYWMSSRVMRQASARQGIMKKQTDEAKADAFVNQPMDEYQIVIQGADMVPFVRKDEKFFQANAFLQTKKTKQKISPSHVRFERDKEGVLVTAAVFLFPKKSSSGNLTINPDEKSVEFSCKIEGSTLRVNFEPPKMVDQNGPDL